MRKIIYGLIAAGCIMVSLITGCHGAGPLVSATKIQGYTKAESMLVIGTERYRYEQIYTDRIWQTRLNSAGFTYEDYILSQVKTFLVKLKTMNTLAQSQGIELTGSEKDLIQKASDEYFDSLSDTDKKTMDITIEDIHLMYGEYCMANKVVGELTKDVDLEISDSEAKVIEINQIELEDKETADRVLEIVKEGDSSFTEQAGIYSQNATVSYKLGRGSARKEYEEAAFSLSAGEISDVIESDGRYYIIQCVNDYDESETEIRKKQLATDKKNKAFETMYSQFVSEHEMAEEDEWWDNIVFSNDNKIENGEFFNIYHKYFDDK